MSDPAIKKYKNKQCDLCSRLARWVICPSDWTMRYVASDYDGRETLFKHHESWSDLCRVAKECDSCSLFLHCFVEVILETSGLDELETNLARQRLLSEEDSLTPDSELCTPYISEDLSDLPSEYLVSMAESDIDANLAQFAIGYHTLNYGMRRGQFWISNRAVFVLCADADTCAIREGHIVGRKITSFPEWSLAMQWIQACKTEHSECETESSVQVPAILIDVGSSQDSDIVRLIQSDQGKYDYITLSHRWGGAQSGVTTTNNFVERQSGFCQDQLPLNFRDAISITRRLEYRYLWIDCVCIKQDSLEDWERQCSQMAAIYRGSSLTIAAAAARNSHVGILHPRPGPSPSSSCILEHRDDNGFVKGQVRLFCPGLHESHQFTDPQFKSVLKERGWILQERILSPRVLNFGKRQIYWECREARHFESVHFPLTDPFNIGQFIGAGKSPPNSDEPTKLQKWWDDLMEHYSECNLTEPMDRLPAISGIASLFQNLTGSKYLGGLWLNDMPAGLLWDRRWSRINAYPDGCVKYKAPSWSWVSFNGPISYRMKPGRLVGTHEVLEPLIEIVDASVEQVGFDQFGLLKSGSLKVRGKMKLGAIYAWPAQKSLPEEKWSRSLYLCDEGLKVRKKLAVYRPDRPEKFDKQLSLLPEAFASDAFLTDVHCLLIGKAKRTSQQMSNLTYYYWAIALEKDMKCQAYRRIGLLHSGNMHLSNILDLDLESWFHNCDSQVIEMI